ncbi:MAG: DegV family protein [Lachnospiraceae bacterium]|jgi:DegV family protein with EDD domain|nr:DegV family protein [Lachnospiraceae bacterium]
MKVAVVTDSNSGVTATEAKELGVYVLPMPCILDGKTYYEGIDMSIDSFYEHLAEKADVSTSQPSPDSVMKIWDEALKEADQVVHIPMSSGLSGSCQTAMMLAEDYDGKVEVINNQRISVTQKHSVIDAVRLSEKGKTAKEIKDILEADKFNSSIYIMMDTLYYLKKGGRITPAAAALGTLLKLKPVLQIQGEKLDAFAKARTVSQAKSIMISAIRNDAEKRFGGISPENIKLAMAYTHNLPEITQFKAEVEEAFPGIEITNVDPLSMSVGCHIGTGALAVTITKKLPIDSL